MGKIGNKEKDDHTILSLVAEVNHLKLTCEKNTYGGYSIYKDTFECIGELKDLNEWRILSESIKLLDTNR